MLYLAGAVNPTLLYISSEALIPVPYQVRGRLSQARNPTISALDIPFEGVVAFLTKVTVLKGGSYGIIGRDG